MNIKTIRNQVALIQTAVAIRDLESATQMEAELHRDTLRAIKSKCCDDLEMVVLASEALKTTNIEFIRSYT